MTRAPLNREAILDAALALADGSGLNALTMRALGSELGVEASSLYKHVNGKEDILDGLIDRLYAQVRVGNLRRALAGANAGLRR
jgi:TetR/AcrR family tetracycline transcriptional repressor